MLGIKEGKEQEWKLKEEIINQVRFLWLWKTQVDWLEQEESDFNQKQADLKKKTKS